MMEKVLICVLDLYYSLIEAIFLSFTVLRIKFKRPNHQKSLTEPKGHLALRLNDGRVLSSSDLFDLIDYCKGVFGVKYLTLIAGSGGFEREIDIREHLSNSISIYNNYQFLYTSTTPSPKIHVNLVDNDSSSLFLLKLKETIETTHESTGLKVQQKEILYQSALKSFTSNLGFVFNFNCMCRFPSD